MSDAICLQPWVSLSGNANTVLQDAAEWLDVSGYQGVAVYTEVTYVSDQVPTTALDLQASATREEVLFGAKLSAGGNPWVVSYSFSSSPPLGVQPIAIRRWTDASVATTPPQRLLRWRVRFPAVDTAIVFRIWVNLFRNAGAPDGETATSPRGGQHGRGGGSSARLPGEDSPLRPSPLVAGRRRK